MTGVRPTDGSSVPVIRSMRFLPQSTRGSHEYFVAVVRVPVPGDKRIVAEKAVEFLRDDGADESVLGTTAVSTLGLKRRHMLGVDEASDYKGQASKNYHTTGELLFVSPERGLSRFRDIWTETLTFCVPLEAFEADATDDPDRDPPPYVDSLLGQDVLQFLTQVGEKRGTPGVFDWVYFKPKKLEIGGQHFSEGKFRVTRIGNAQPLKGDKRFGTE